MQLWGNEDPALVIERAHGNWLIDAQGGRYLDGCASLWCNVFGHRRPEIDAAIRAQLERVAHTTLLGLSHAGAEKLAQKLISVVPPGLRHVFFSDSGSTAVEAALKIAIQFWRENGRPQKSRFVALKNAYHGDTLGSVSVGGIDKFNDIFQHVTFDALRLAPDATALSDVLSSRAHEIAALIVEPLVQGAAGMLLSPPGFLAQAAQLCRKHDVLLIADEVATGFGRTGKMFACEHENVSPDILCLGKGLTGGYLPLAATVASDRVFQVFLGEPDERRTFFHGHTYTGNPLGCAAAIATLDIFAHERIVDSLPKIVEQLRVRLQSQIAPLPQVREIRQLGLMVGIDLGDRPLAERAGHRVCMAIRKQGVILRPLGNVVVWTPPLSITEQEIDLLASATRAAILEICP